MLEVTVQNPSSGHCMRWRDLPREHVAGDSVAEALEPIHVHFRDIIHEALGAREPSDMAALVLANQYGMQMDAHEERRRQDADRGIEHAREIGHMGSGGDNACLLVRVKVRPLFGQEGERWMDQRVLMRDLRGLACRLSVNRIESVEEFVARLVFDAVVDALKRVPAKKQEAPASCGSAAQHCVVHAVQR